MMNTVTRINLLNIIQRNDYLVLRQKANWVRRKVLDMAVKAQSGHITTAFSLTELFLSLYHGILRFDPKNIDWKERDRFILSEGQAGIGLYPVLADAGFFPVSRLETFVQKESTLGVHSEPGTSGIQVLTGSLGHGLPIATGMAYVGKTEKAPWLVFCLTGDGELSEGSNWEALITAATIPLNNLVVIVNRNHQFAIGFNDRRETQRDILLDSIDEKFKAFGFDTRNINGHSFNDIFDVFKDVRERIQTADRPLAIIAETEKGYGGFFSNKREWHYRVPESNDLKMLYTQLTQEAEVLGIDLCGYHNTTGGLDDEK